MSLDHLKDWIVLFSVAAMAVINWIYSVKGAPSLQTKIADLLDRVVKLERLCTDAETRWSQKAGETTAKVGTAQMDIAVVRAGLHEVRERIGRIEKRIDSAWRTIGTRVAIREDDADG